MAFPYLYNNRPRKVRLSPYHYPMVMYIKMEDPDLPAFYYDPLIHPIAFYKSDAPSGTEVLDDDEENAFALPEGEHDSYMPFILAAQCKNQYQYQYQYLAGHDKSCMIAVGRRLRGLPVRRSNTPIGGD